MRRVGGAAVGVLIGAVGWPAAAQQRASCADRDACVGIVHRYTAGRRAAPEETRDAIDRVRGLCADGEGRACWDLARWTALGVEDIVTPDLDAARVFAKRSCDLGSDCKVLEALSHPPPTAAEEDDIREAVFRDGIPTDRQRNVVGQSPVYCLAFGADADPTGQDPSPVFMARFADLEDVHPRSWCVKHRTGNRLSLGPLDARPDPFSREPTVRMWLLVQDFDGSAGAWMVHVTKKAGTWVLADEYGGSTALPPLPKADLDEERQRIAATASTIAEAWNRRDFEAIARLNASGTPFALATSANSGREIRGPGADTHLDPAAETIEFGQTGSMSATARLRLRGTWTPSPGAIVPLDPWKHAGSVTTVRLHLRKRTSWWEPGDWEISFIGLPWVRAY